MSEQTDLDAINREDEQRVDYMKWADRHAETQYKRIKKIEQIKRETLIGSRISWAFAIFIILGITIFFLIDTGLI